MYNLQVLKNRIMFNYMHAKFEVTGFHNKRDIPHRSLYFACFFLLRHAFTGQDELVAAVKFRLVMKISDPSIKISHQIYMLPTFLYFNKVLCIRGMWVGYFSIPKLLTPHAFI